MRETVLRALLIVAAGLALGLVANTVSPRRSRGRYFNSWSAGLTPLVYLPDPKNVGWYCPA